MKKSLLSLLGLVLAFSALFVSCDDDSENSGIPCEIYIIASEGGDVQFSDYFGTSKHVYTGSKVTIIATADEGYVFIGWYVVGDNEKLVSDKASYTFATQGDLQLVAKFGKLQDITISSSDGGSVSFKDSEEKTMHLLPGAEVTVVATPDEYYTFDGWYNGETQVSTESEYSFEVSSSLLLVAKFSEYPSVTVNSFDGGSASIAGSTETSIKILPGAEVTVVATPDEDYYFTGWYNGETQVSTESEYSFEVSSSLLLVAKFSECPSVTVNSSDGGSASIAGSTETSIKILPGAEVTVVATPDEDYYFTGWYNGETQVSTESEYSFEVSSSLLLVAKFSECPSVTVNSSDGGSASIAGSTETSIKILPGAEVTVVATVAEGYGFAGWYLGNNLVSKDAEYSFTVSTSVNLVAKFLEIFTVTVSSTDGGVAVIKGTTENIKDVLYGRSITLLATRAKGCEFAGWFIGDSEVAVSTDVEYTFIVSESIVLIAKFKQAVNGHEYVDLGLPSGLKWATCNIGASSPEDYGGYYAWGETKTKNRYYQSDYLYYNERYNYYEDIGSDISGTNYDVAHVKWGGTWRMPTRAEQDELRNNCTCTWTTLNGVYGRKVTGPSGNSIFLPAAGYRSGKNIYRSGSHGYYWSSSFCSFNISTAYFLYFYDGLYDWNNGDFYYGFSVRPVTE